MWSNKALGLVALGLIGALASLPAAARSSAQHRLACPNQLGGKILIDGQVLDGPIVDNAILQGDDMSAGRFDERDGWIVGYVYEQGRKVSLECNYAGGGKTFVTTAKRVDRCLFTRRKRAVRLSCYR